MKGCFITFEGIEGSGKSTQMALLAQRLQQKGWDVLTTREPGGTQLGEDIRKLLLDTRNHQMAPKTELLLYLASRAQHLQEVIIPALEKDRVVLCDRFSEATLAYQGYGRRMALGVIRSLAQYAADGRTPDLILLLDVPVRRGLIRIRSRNRRDRMEQERNDFHERVRQGYLRLAKLTPRRTVVINAGRDFQKVAGQIQKTVEARLQPK